jgi:hypothetical protein
MPEAREKKADLQQLLDRSAFIFLKIKLREKSSLQL